MPFVFVSYDHDDDIFAEKLIGDLRAARVALWIDQSALVGGTQWMLAIQNAIEDSSHMVLLLSPASVAKDSFVLKEISYAIIQKKPIVPLMIAPCTAPIGVADLQYIDFTTDYQDGLEKLLAILPQQDEFSAIRQTTPQRYRKFWQDLLRDAKRKTALHARCKAPKRNMVAATAGYPGIKYRYALHGLNGSVQVFIGTDDKPKNKRLFAALIAQKESIEEAYGGPLTWERLDKHKSCRIRAFVPTGSLRDEATWPTTQTTLITAMRQLEAAFRDPISALER